jgi:hypothetical protein
VAGFPAGGKNRVARLSVSPGQAARDAQRRWQARNGIVTSIAAGARSLDRQEIGLGQRCGVPLSGDGLACLPAGLAVIGRRRCAAQLLPSDTDMT